MVMMVDMRNVENRIIVQGSRFRVQRFRVQGSGFKGSRVQGSRFKGSRVQRFKGSRVQGFRVQGSRLYFRPRTAFGMRIYEKSVSSPCLIQNLAPNWQLFGKMSIL